MHISLPFTFVSFLAGTCLFGVTAANAQDELCGQYPVGQSSYACTCTPDAAVGSVWGSGPYTADSNFCTAAFHAGVIGLDGGSVVALEMGPQEFFVGSEANFVVSGDWGPYPNSFIFDSPVSAAAASDIEACMTLPNEAEVYRCGCDAAAATSGKVWGSGPYTADSSICKAALHAGVIGPEGGEVLVLRTEGLQNYQGSEVNYVQTESWGAFGSSFVFELLGE
ncbi:MAG: LCCL domain-containing protein [Rhodobacterales bacterium]|nr:LCCL domain-containing protein [Rhodobacterales bacterium]